MKKPLTFSQRWKVATVALVAGAGIVATAVLLWLIWIVWAGPWTLAVEALRVNFLAQVAMATTILMGASMLGLLIAGPLSKLSGKIGEAEISAEGD